MGQNKGESFGFGKPHYLSENAGEYELKVLRNKKLARSIKFTVGPDGGFENGINAANKIGGRRVIVPVMIIGDQDGPWDKSAWRTDAFYGNPLTGFTPAP
nr:D602 [uncultured bacterium]